ncbi:MAG: sialidase family protein [Armatimonadota bacterium]|nr:sialidase family protein [Armatimonadota bacterium]
MHPIIDGGVVAWLTVLVAALCMQMSQAAAAKPLTVPEPFEHSFPTDEGYRGGAMVKLANGNVLLAYGKPGDLRGEIGSVKLYGVESADGGRTWGPERLLEQNPDCQTGRPSFLRTADGRIWMFYYGYVGFGGRTDNSQSDLWAVYSADEGQTWQGRRRVFQGYTGATNGAIQTSSGNILVPFSYLQDPQRFVSACAVSTDSGETWQTSEAIDLADAGGHGSHAGALEPSVVELRDGRVWMLIRTKLGRFLQSYSQDGGLTWSSPEDSRFRSPNSPCQVVRLSSGDLAIAWNNTMDTTRDRQALSVALSGDDGETWTEPTVCATASEVSYPFILEAGPGQLLISSGRLRAEGLSTDMVVLRLSEQMLLE